jgi:hypothetical protein
MKVPNPEAIEITVDPEETLSGIAVRKLGVFDDEVLHQIVELNPGLGDPNRIYSGEKILLPSRHSSPDPDVRKR